MTFSTQEDVAVLTGLAWTGLGADDMVRMHAVHQHRLQAWGGGATTAAASASTLSAMR